MSELNILHKRENSTTFNPILTEEISKIDGYSEDILSDNENEYINKIISKDNSDLNSLQKDYATNSSIQTTFDAKQNNIFKSEEIEYHDNKNLVKEN